MGPDASDPHGIKSDTKSPLVSIVIPVYGEKHYLDALLDSLEVHTPEAHELILVDNGTGHDIEPRSNRKILRNEQNEGYAAATNAGVALATADLVLLLNVDIVANALWLAPLLQAFQDNAVGMAGPKLVYPDGRIQCAGIRTWHGSGSAGGSNRLDDHDSNSDEQGVTGAAMMIRRQTFNALGGLDETFWNGYEDVDLCLRVIEAGHRIAYVAESSMIHHESVSGPERWSKSQDNVNYMSSKWGNR